MADGETMLSAQASERLDAPTGLAFGGLSKNRVTIFWNPVWMATSYLIWVNRNPVGQPDYAVSETTAELDIEPGTQYTVYVVAWADGYTQSLPAILTFFNQRALGEITGFSYSSLSESSVTLNWDQLADAEEYTLLKGTRIIFRGGETSFTDDEIHPGEICLYTLTATARNYYPSPDALLTVTNYDRLPTPALLLSAQDTSSVTLSVTSFFDGGTMRLLKNGAEIASQPGHYGYWRYTDSLLAPGTLYVYEAYLDNEDLSGYYPSLKATIQARLTDFTAVQRQRDYLRSLRRPFVKLCRLRFLNQNNTTAFALDNNRKNKRGRAFIADGNVTANLQNGQRLSATVTLENTDGAYNFDLNKIWFGQRVAIDEGLVLSNGQEYWRQTGIFVIDNPRETLSPGQNTVTYNLLDKWADLDGTLGGNLEGTYEVPLGTNIFQPMDALLKEDRGNGTAVDNVNPVFTEYYNGMSQELPDGSEASMVLSPYTLTEDGDGGTRGSVILGLGGMVNAWVGYDNTGRLRIDPSQDDILDAQKAVLYRFSREEATLLGLAYTVKKEDVYNDYIVVGEQLDDYSQPGGRASNYDPKSDTNILLIGRKTKRESASGFATVTQCRDLAEWRLKRSGILQKAVSVSCSQMFHIELNSLVEIVRTDKPGSPIERHVVQGYTRPLASSGNMTITAVSTADFPEATITTWPEGT